MTSEKFSVIRETLNEFYKEGNRTRAVLAIVLALLTSFCFAASSLFAQRGLHLFPTPWGAWITLAINTLFLLGFHFFLYPDAPIFAAANLVFVAVGVFVPGLTRVLTFRGIRTMGSAVTSTVVNTTPMFSTLMAMALLNERPGFIVLCGVMLIVGGLMALSWGKESRNWHRIELLYPLLSAFLFAAKDVTVRWGLGATGQPILAAAIAAITSTVEVYLILRYVQGQRFTLPPARVSRWFIVSGLFTGGSFLFMFLALSMERVSVVSPIVNSYSVFVLLLTPLMARRIERVTLRKVIGAAVVVAGVFLISVGRN